MPVTLRRRPECHYCGKRLNTAKREGSKITCEQCSADNFFDSDNNIIDVPETVVNRPSSQFQPTEVESDSDIFCKQCLTNQAFYVQALANYLPDENHPQYDSLLHRLPEYKRDLEIRYPQCCLDCERRSAGRIQEANYLAKSDHLRRLMQRTSDQRRSRHLLRSLLISAAGLGYAVSLGVQLLWHGLSSQVNSQDIVPGISRTRCLTTWPIPAQCTQYVASLIPTSLLVGLICIWWNPKWQHRLQGKEGRLVGLSKYYQLQLAIMTLRFFAWAVVQDLPVMQRNVNALHTLLLLLLSTMSIYNLTSTVSVDTTPLVDWQQVQAPLVRPDQFRPPPQALHSPPSSQGGSNLNIADFGGPVASSYDPWRPPTPPHEDDDMDWAPSQDDFKPQPRIPKLKFEQPTPFHGTLPAAPTRGSLNLKKPAPPQKKALGLPPGFFGLSKSRRDNQAAAQPHTTAGEAFMPARFFPDKREADTGLESIFDKMFSVRDVQGSSIHEQDVDASKKNGAAQYTQSSDGRQMLRQAPTTISAQPTARLILSCTIVVALAVLATSLCSLEYLRGGSTSSASTVLPYTALIPAAHLLEEAIFTGQIEIAGLAVSALEISLVIATKFFLSAVGPEMVPMWNRMVVGAIFFFLLQEIYHFCQLQSTPSSTPHVRPHASVKQEPPVLQSAPISQESTEDIPLSQLVRHKQQEPQTRHVPPTPIQRHTFQPQNYTSLRKRDSDESISSVSSINTTSTASGWKTPQNPGRTFDWQSQPQSVPGNRNARHRTSTSSASLGLGGLSLGGRDDYGSGANVAGPRSRVGQGGGNGRYR